MRNDAVAWRTLTTTNVGDNDGTVRADAQLGAVRITDPYPFLESESGLQPRHRRSHVRINEHWSNGRGRRRTIRQHGETVTGNRCPAPRLRGCTPTPSNSSREVRMRLGFFLPSIGPLAGPDALAQVASR